MSGIKQLLEYDEANSKMAIEALEKMVPEALEAADSCHDLLRSIAYDMGEKGEYADHQSILGEWANSLGLEGTEAIGLLDRAKLVGNLEAEDPSVRAKDSFMRSLAFLARSQIAMTDVLPSPVGISQRLGIPAPLLLNRSYSEACHGIGS